MNVSDYMEKHHLTDEALDAMAEPYEQGDYISSEGAVHHGSHVAATATKRITVIYDIAATQRAAELAKKRGVETSEVYRDALDYYLAAQG